MRVCRGALCMREECAVSAVHSEVGWAHRAHRHIGSHRTPVSGHGSLPCVSRARLHYPLAYARAVSRVVSRVPACAANRHTSHNNNNNNTTTVSQFLK